MANKSFRREGMDKLPTGDYVVEATTVNTLELKEKIVTFLIFAYSFVLVSTIFAIIANGFHLCGFNMGSDSSSVFNALYGELAGLFAMVIGSLFPIVTRARQ